MLTRFLGLVLLSVSANVSAGEWVLSNQSCYGSAPLHPPTTSVLADRIYRINGVDSARFTLRRSQCADGSTALFATTTAYDAMYMGGAVLFNAIQNGTNYSLRFSHDPLTCDMDGLCLMGLPFGAPIAVGVPSTSVVRSAYNLLENGPAFDDEKDFTLSLTGSFPQETTTYSIPASGASGGQLPLSRTISDNLTGTWWNANRGGEGITFDVGTLNGKRYLFFSWYTYFNREGIFLSGSKELPATAASTLTFPVYRTKGTHFGTQFIASELITTAVGSVTIERVSCNAVTMSYTGSLGAFTAQTIVPLWSHSFGTSCS